MSASEPFDLRTLPVSFYEDPYPTYARLRAESPVYACPDGSYFLTRYDDINRVYRDPRRFSSDKRIQFAPVFGTGSPLYEHHTTSLVFNDPPLHTRVRKAIGNALSMQMVRAMQAGLETLVDELLDAMQARQQVDLIADYAAAIPIEIIGNMLGVPKVEREPLRRWSLSILGALEVGLDEDKLADGNACVTEFLSYLQDFVPRRRAELAAADDDILARLIRWQDDRGGLAPKELYHQCIFLLNAGHETTTNLIGNGVELLLRYPEQRKRLQQRPELIDTAVEEMLRFESSNQLGNRTTTEAVEIGGVQIPNGTVLTLCIGAANRDPEQFDDADRFDIARTHNPHLAFAAGIHTCAGLNVARLEGRVAIGRFFERFPQASLAAEPVRAQRARFRGFSQLPLKLH
jgi:cytochrome P450